MDILLLFGVGLGAVVMLTRRPATTPLLAPGVTGSTLAPGTSKFAPIKDSAAASLDGSSSGNINIRGAATPSQTPSPSSLATRGSLSPAVAQTAMLQTQLDSLIAKSKSGKLTNFDVVHYAMLQSVMNTAVKIYAQVPNADNAQAAVNARAAFNAYAAGVVKDNTIR